jgi:hypothetical protein
MDNTRIADLIRLTLFGPGGPEALDANERQR